MAIAFDAASGANYSASGTTNTFSHTCTGSDRILFVVAAHHSTSPVSSVTGITYASVAMTFLRTYQSGNAEFDLYYLVAPSTGANNVVITMDISDASVGIASSYTGVSQTSPIDVSGDGGPTTTTAYSQSVTTTTDNCWSIMVGGAYSGLAITAGANTVVRTQPEVSLTGTFLADTGSAQTPAGTDTIAVTSSSQSFTTIMAAFKPVAAGPTTVKTWDGITQSTGIKTYLTASLATTKTVNGAS